jgi:thiamine biosynthesis protein ThiS
VNVTINGEKRSITPGTTVASLLEDLSLKPEATVVQRNDNVLERARYRDTALADGDVLELVRFVGGG